jgi:hypothetical protein
MKNFFTSYKNPVTVLVVIIIMGGLFGYSKLQTALFPEITFPKIKIIADAGQQPVKKMMITVTRQLENAIKPICEGSAVPPVVAPARSLHLWIGKRILISVSNASNQKSMKLKTRCHPIYKLPWSG